MPGPRRVARDPKPRDKRQVPVCTVAYFRVLCTVCYETLEMQDQLENPERTAILLLAST